MKYIYIFCKLPACFLNVGVDLLVIPLIHSSSFFDLVFPCACFNIWFGALHPTMTCFSPWITQSLHYLWLFMIKTHCNMWICICFPFQATCACHYGKRKFEKRKRKKKERNPKRWFLSQMGGNWKYPFGSKTNNHK